MAGEPNPNPPAPPAGAPPETPPAHFFDSLPEDVKSYPGLAKFKADKPEEAFAQAIRSYSNMEKLVGSKVAIPDEKTPPEVAKEFWAKIGVPEKVEDYEPPAVPEGFEADKTLIDGFLKTAHENKIPKSAAKKMMDWYVQQEIGRIQQAQVHAKEAIDKGMKELHMEWGAATDQNVGLCQQVVAELGGPGLKAALEETGAGNHPAVVKFLAKIGSILAEDKVITAPQSGESADAVKAKLAAVQADPKHPFWDTTNPGHKAAVEEVKRLNELAYPNL